MDTKQMLRKVDNALQTKIVGQNSLTGGEAVGFAVFLGCLWYYFKKKQDKRVLAVGFIVQIVMMIAY